MADSIFSTRLTPEKLPEPIMYIPFPSIRGYSNGISPE